MSEMLWPLWIYHSIPTASHGRLGSSITEDGSFHFWTSGVSRDRPEIGYYIHDFGAARVRAFRNLVEEAGLWDLPDTDTLYPEEPNVYLMAGDWKGPKRSVMWSIDALPPELLPILDAFQQLVAEASASPVRVLGGEARWSAPSFYAREPLRLEFTLHNRGSGTIVFDDPTGQYEGSFPLDLLLEQVTSPEQEEPPSHRVDITPDMLSRPDQTDPLLKGTPGDLLELAPGQALRFAAKCFIYLSPGEYQAVLRFEMQDRENGPRDLVDGVLALELPTLRIVHRR